jgi:hypothetical protein
MVPNFGANLQALSTVSYFRKNGYEPVVINWISKELQKEIQETTTKEQWEAHLDFLKKNLSLSRICGNEKEIADIIAEENIEAIIIGSDAVVQHHPLLSRIVLSKKKIIEIGKYTPERMFPNPFWGTFLAHLQKPIPVIAMSVSSQDSMYRFFNKKLCKKMNDAILNYSYLSVRDAWTQNMYRHITRGKVIPQITPDPVFAFNKNVTDEQLSREYITVKFKLPERYILVSFAYAKTVSKKWLSRFKEIINQAGYECIALPTAQGIKFNHKIEKQIPLPLSPLEWYALIKYSNGYVGHNMHPILVAIHNNVPFFSFDNYGIKLFNIFTNPKSSKIYHILSEAGLSEHRKSCIGNFFLPPKPGYVFKKLINTDVNKTRRFSERYLWQYDNMMQDICGIIDIKT